MKAERRARVDYANSAAARRERSGRLKLALKVFGPLAAGGVFCAAAFYFWMSSLNITAAPAEPAESFNFKTGSFQVYLPRTFRLVSFVGALQWPGERIRFTETAYEGPEESARRFDEAVNAYQGWEVGGQVVNVSRRFGRPAWLAARFSPKEGGGADFSLRLAVRFETGWVSFEQSSPLDAPAENDSSFDDERKISLFLSRAWKFLHCYVWLGLAADENAEGEGFRTRYGRLVHKHKIPLDYLYAVQSAEFEDQDGRFFVWSAAERPAAEFRARPWERLKSFLGALWFKREVNRSLFSPLTLGGRTGRELQLLSRNLSEPGVEAFRVFWQADEDSCEEACRYVIGLETAGTSGQAPGAALARWRAITATWRQAGALSPETPLATAAAAKGWAAPARPVEIAGD